jgi:hypothetical protein
VISCSLMDGWLPWNGRLLFRSNWIVWTRHSIGFRRFDCLRNICLFGFIACNILLSSIASTHMKSFPATEPLHPWLFEVKPFVHGHVWLTSKPLTFTLHPFRGLRSRRDDGTFSVSAIHSRRLHRDRLPCFIVEYRLFWNGKEVKYSRREVWGRTCVGKRLASDFFTAIFYTILNIRFWDI